MIVAALKVFDERTRQVLVHRIVDGMKNKDVARVIGLSEGQTSRLWFGAVEKLGEVVRRKIAEASQERAASLKACLESTLGWRAGNPLDRFFSGLMNLEEAKT
ncbi:MAG TPA: sigma factor-like helix-turn-helix DNA-binding protein [Pirellulaceae bacterium]|nr:sigma factor-like helix-turn-helix DNA-binding protein [Pirellulaceae bacterium]